MTGSAHAEKSLGLLDVSVDVKTVNSRFLDLNLRLPRELTSLEPEVRREIQARISRGRVDIAVSVTSHRDDQYTLNEPLVRNYVQMADQMRQKGIEGQLSVAQLLQLPGVLLPTQADFGATALSTAVLSVVREALGRVVEMRTVEGEAIRRDLEARIESVAALLNLLEEGAERIREHYRAKLVQRLQELGAGVAIDQARLAQELLYYVERSDSAEERTRLRAHLERFRHYLAGSEATGTGKNLDFLCQEMNREMNTILSKSPLPEDSQRALEGKAEVERIREQVQNVE